MVWLIVPHFSQLPLANQKCIDFSVLIVRNIRDFACFHLFLVLLVDFLDCVNGSLQLKLSPKVLSMAQLDCWIHNEVKI